MNSDLLKIMQRKQFYCIFDCIQYLYYAGYPISECLEYSSCLFNSKLDLDLSNITDEKKIFLLSFINGCELNININNKQPSIIYWNKDNKNYFYQNLKNGDLWVDYSHIWSVFETKYLMKYYEIQAFISNTMEEGVKLKGFTPRGNETGLLYGKFD